MTNIASVFHRHGLALACAAGLAASVTATTGALAADPPTSDRATPGSVVPSTGVTQPEPPAPPKTMAAPAPAPSTTPTPSTPPTRPSPPTAPVANAGSLSGAPPGDCAALRQAYARSQACFAPYRLANGGLKPEAAGRCTEVANPVSRCGPEVVSPK